MCKFYNEKTLLAWFSILNRFSYLISKSLNSHSIYGFPSYKISSSSWSKPYPHPSMVSFESILLFHSNPIYSQHVQYITRYIYSCTPRVQLWIIQSRYKCWSLHLDMPQQWGSCLPKQISTLVSIQSEVHCCWIGFKKAKEVRCDAKGQLGIWPKVNHAMRNHLGDWDACSFLMM